VSDIGVSDDRREAMVDVNVTGTERVLGAALSAGVAKAVLVSSVAVYGDTHGPGRRRALAARRRRAVRLGVRADLGAGPAAGARDLGARAAARGRAVRAGLRSRRAAGAARRARQLPVRTPERPAVPRARRVPGAPRRPRRGVLLALDKGTPGESYVLAGEPVRSGDVLRELADVSGRRRRP
jgi:dihydroflavonol-4-reductase